MLANDCTYRACEFFTFYDHSYIFVTILPWWQFRFFYPCDFCGDDYLEYIPYCSGKGLLCANTRMKSMGSEIDEENNFIMPEALESPDVIGDILKPPPMNCIAACRLETNDIDMSFAPYPQQEVFFYQKAFCNTASHIR